MTMPPKRGGIPRAEEAQADRQGWATAKPKCRLLELATQADNPEKPGRTAPIKPVELEG